LVLAVGDFGGEIQLLESISVALLTCIGSSKFGGFSLQALCVVDQLKEWGADGYRISFGHEDALDGPAPHGKGFVLIRGLDQA
jgi:hypothetical protein